LPAALGSNAAHRSKAATFATRLTQHVRQAEEAYWTREEPPSCLVIVIQIFVKTLNFCIIKTPESPVPADPYAKSRVFWSSKNHPEAARLGDHFLSERPEK
jgi:hypothetical protein